MVLSKLTCNSRSNQIVRGAILIYFLKYNNNPLYCNSNFQIHDTARSWLCNISAKKNVLINFFFKINENQKI